MKQVSVTVLLTIKDDADPQEVVQEVDYTFNHEDIIDTEITEIDYA
jgi:hypothetical protein